MANRLATMCIVVMFLGGLAAPFAEAQDSDSHVVSLKGISALAVLVERLPDGAKVLGLTKETIQTDVEQKLRLGGVRVVAAEEAQRLPGGPHLYVNVNLTNDGRVAKIDVELDQDITLVRNDQSVPAVATWKRGGLIAPNSSAQQIRDVIKAIVNQFLNAWRSVNPKK